ncbi:unnamed protein product [Mesocestoides corti]|uniref:Uncharacterized protein n=1 Tax=Mesocestoides corti TaxID=53468 RepID=A0A0R3UBK5_MESCO|nr:unnamed protein product [Mesocestoides corti]
MLGQVFFIASVDWRTSEIVPANSFYRSHEWAKHGSCATTRHQLIPDQHAYFATSLELKRQFNFTSEVKMPYSWTQESALTQSSHHLTAHKNPDRLFGRIRL